MGTQVTIWIACICYVRAPSVVSQKYAHILFLFHIVLDSGLFSLSEGCCVFVDFRVNNILAFKYSWPSSVRVFQN